MCQLCGIKDIATSSRWPKPLEQPVKDLDFLIDAAHEEWESFRKTAPSVREERVSASLPLVTDARQSTTPPPESLLDTLRAIHTAVESLEEFRAHWWTAPEKRRLRAQLEAEGDQRKLTELHKINNSTSSRIEAINARLGTFVKWSLGCNGGVWELMASEKVGR